MRRIGYWMNDKKIKKLNFHIFIDLAWNAGIELVKIDLSEPIVEQGPFDAILHKFTDVVGYILTGDETAASYMRNIQEFQRVSPQTIFVDPLSSMIKLIDRYESYKAAKMSTAGQSGGLHISDNMIGTPPFVKLDSANIKYNMQLLNNAGVTFPIVCKPLVGHGLSDCHKMAIIFNETGLKDVGPPCVCQNFINHNAILFKAFVVGDNFFLGDRPSIKNLNLQDHSETIFFHSHEVSKLDSASHLNDVLDESSKQKPDIDRVENIVKSLRSQLGMALFGVDIIIDVHSGKHYIIDINAFPAYDGIPEFFTTLLSHLQDVTANTMSGRKPLTNGQVRLPGGDEKSLTPLLRAVDSSPCQPTRPVSRAPEIIKCSSVNQLLIEFLSESAVSNNNSEL